MAAMVDERGAQARLHCAGMTGTVECRYYGHDFTAQEMALLRALIAGPPPLNRQALSKEFCRRIAWFQARRRAQGHDGQGHHAGHAQGRPDRPAGTAGTAEPAPPDRLRAGHRSAAVHGADGPRRGPPARPANRPCAAPGRASSGTSSSPATTISDTRPWSAPRCATPFMTETAGRSPCSASAPPRGSSPRATLSSDRHPSCARRTYPSSSTTRGS